MNTEINTITVRNSFDGGQVTFDKKIEDFSIILCLELGNWQGVIEIAPELKIATKNINIIKRFVEIHEYDLKNIRTPQVGLHRYNQFCTKQTQKFIEQCLKSKSDDQIKQLFETCNYFKVQALSRLLSLYILEKYNLSFIDKEVKKTLEQCGVSHYGRAEVQKIKEDYFQYFKVYGQKILMEIDIKKTN